MGVGQTFLWGATLLGVGSFLLYCFAGNAPDRARAARTFWYLHTAVTALAVAALWWIILTKDYAYEYVVGYTSDDLNFWYRLSAFWAGQEGSFLLWAAMGCAIGLFLIWRARDFERETMIWVSLVQLALFALMLLKSPFAPMPGAPPADGTGLNPLLQNPWMVIHPPLVFLGYAAMVLPFAFAMAALMKREYDGWVTRALPWCGFAWLSLGAGILVGGYWAYETLGWGGYWGWDPVENASLVPWLLGTALLHGLIVQKSTGSLKAMNSFLAAFSFVTVVYGTYLTRSGVLGDFSVHSFADMGQGYNACLLAFITVPLVAWSALFVARKREIQSEKAYGDPRSLAFFLHLGIIVLLISAGLVGIGMSSPILTGVLTHNPAAVQLSYYNLTHTPVGIALAFLVMFAPLLPWKSARWSRVRAQLRWPLVVGALGVIGTLIGTWFYARSESQGVGAALGKAIPWYLLIGFAVTALCVNAAAVLAHCRAGRRLQAGAPLAHTGLALMLISFVGSSAYDRERKVMVALGESKPVLGYQLSHRGTQERPDKKLQINVDVERQGKTFQGKALMYETRQGLMRTPAIKRGLLADLYVEPESLDPGEAPQPTETTAVAQGESETVGPYEVTFEAFDTSQHGQAGAMVIGAKLKISKAGKTEEVVPLYEIKGQEISHPPAEFDGGKATVALMGMIVESRTVQLHFEGDAVPSAKDDQPVQKERVVIQVTHKPLMTPLWIGCVLLLSGGALAIRRRAVEARHQEVRADRKRGKRDA